MKVSEEAVVKVKGELNVGRDKRRAIQKMDAIQLSSYLVDIYRQGFEDGANMVISQDDEIKMDWDDVLNVIAEFVSGETLMNIDKRVKEMAG